MRDQDEKGKWKRELTQLEETIETNLGNVFTYDEARHGRETRGAKLLLSLRNIAAGAAGLLFLLSLLLEPPALRAVAYFTGAAAYLAEILLMTECFRGKASHDERFMAYVFGPMYVLLGLSYLAH